MPDTRLISLLTVGPLSAGATVTVEHGLSSSGLCIVPTQVFPDRATPIVVGAVTDTTVTFTNNGSSTETAKFRCEREHSIIVDPRTVEPLTWQGSAAVGVDPTLLPLEMLHYRATHGNPARASGGYFTHLYHTSSYTGSMTAQTVVTGVIKSMLYWSGGGGNVDRLAVQVNTAAVAGSKLRVGIYDVNQATLYPTALVVDSGELDITTTGLKSAPVNGVLLPKRLYALVYVAGDVDSGARVLGGNPAFNSPYGFNTADGTASIIGSSPSGVIEAPYTYAPLPMTFPVNGFLRYGGTQTVTPFLRLA